LDIRLAQAGAFRCLLYPNGLRNGTWLRSYKAWNGSEPYDNLTEQQRHRQWHPLTYFNRWKEDCFVRLRRTLVGDAIGADGTCISASRFWTELAHVRDELIAGTYLPASEEDDYEPGQ
jgi:hypothetical protein